MDKLLSCKFNIDTACVELLYTDGSTLSAVKNKFNYYSYSLLWNCYSRQISRKLQSYLLRKQIIQMKDSIFFVGNKISYWNRKIMFKINNCIFYYILFINVNR